MFLTRLIPAHAGKTDTDAHPTQFERAHPRSRGENTTRVIATFSGCGSSPLTRGKPRSREEMSRGRGLIPAHAGKTAYRCVHGIIASAHPRSRGENPLVYGADLEGRGSSPLTRGKPFSSQFSYRKDGLIPAHAGKTTVGRHRAHERGAHPRSRGENPVRR